MRSGQSERMANKAKIGSLSTLSGSLTLRHKTCADATELFTAAKSVPTTKDIVHPADGHQTALSPGMGRRNLCGRW
ncbi:hypothetical protein CEXT_437051 [Caerostris extrusa]|uniref:Uncharacterized protein n=1 Tax=Caerostris extrusa TaxID=172846 RepID=A0AAV4PJX9_CAEEX|nr:hypothetical protein CEXT_437051 [Caerostris extrusa]